jgi:hypothetical protein
MTTLTRRQILQAGGFAAATLALPTVPAVLAAESTTAVAIAGDPLGRGYWILLSDGSVVARGTARIAGKARTLSRATAVVPLSRGGGFWSVAANGRAVGNGLARLALTPVSNRNSRIVGAATNPRGDGLWRVTARGQLLAAGAVKRLGAPRGDVRIAGMAGHPESEGYWVVDRAGKVFAYGAARGFGQPSTPGRAVGIAAHPSGRGYWVAKTNGLVSAHGASGHHGNSRLGVPVVGIAAAADGGGYWLLHADGRVRAFGSAKEGLAGGSAVSQPRVTTVGGIVVASTISRRVGALLRHAADDGIQLGGWGYRPFTRQVELRRANCGPRYYDVWVKSSSECSPMTARPGSSMHEQGLAIDFYRRAKNGRQVAIAGTRAFKWMARNAKTYGLYNLPSEPWHWSTNGR